MTNPNCRVLIFSILRFISTKCCKTQIVTDGGNANYRIEVVEAGENGFKAQAVSLVDFDKDGVFNVWEIDQDKNLKETVKD